MQEKETHMTQMDHRALEIHVPVLGWLYVVANALFLLVGIVSLILLGGIGLFVDDALAARILILVGSVSLILFAFLALPGIVAGLGLVARKPWARILAMVVGFLGLTAFPIGTVLGLYAFYVLLQDAAHDYFAGSS
jgi:hypothetical protein